MILAHKISLDPTFKQREYFSKAAGCDRFVRLPDGRRILNLVGKTYGMLTATRFIKVTQHGALFLFRCACGRNTVLRGTLVTTGQQRGCGCQIKNINIGRRHTSKIESCIGEKHGRLTIVGSEHKNSRGGYYAKCLCDCGKITKNVYADLLNRKVKSCGCYQAEIASIMGIKFGLNNGRRKYPWYFINENGCKVSCRSGFEVIYATHLVNSGIPFAYEAYQLKTTDGHRYLPDFYLPNENRYVEVKGKWRESQKIKVLSLQEKYSIQILEWPDIVVTCHLPFKTYSSYMRRAIRLHLTVEDYMALYLFKDFPSSKTCSKCGVVKELLTLAERVFHCGQCGFECDRDENAARNIYTLGLRGINACGHDGSDSELLAEATSMDEAGTKPRSLVSTN